MPDSYDVLEVGLSLDLIEDEIEAGLPLHADRLACAWDNEEYYAGRNGLYLRPRIGEKWSEFRLRPRRTSKITRKVVRELTKDLYNPGPTRRLENGAAEDRWLQDVYRQNNINALMQGADRKATLNAVAGIQAIATGRAEKPVQLYLWGAHELTWWTWPDDPTEAWAVCTIQREQQTGANGLEERMRYEAWSRDEHRVYRTAWRQAMSIDAQGYAQTCYRGLFGSPAKFVPEMSGMPEGSGQNPYGCLPFSFVHDEPPVSTFAEGGIGTMLRECNAELDREMSDMAAHVSEFLDPDRFTRNVAPSFVRDRSKGRWQELPASAAAKSGDNALEADAFLVQAQLGVEQGWVDIRAYADATLEELDVPLVAVRNDASTDLSGIAIVAKQLPLLSRTRARQAPFTTHEAKLAEMVLCAAGNYYGEARLTAAAQETALTLVWPEPVFPLPTPERDEQDAADIEAGRKSLVQVTAERMGVTRDQAKEHLETVLDEQQWYADLLESKGMAPAPETPPPPELTPPEPGALPPPPPEPVPNEPPTDENAP